MQRTNKRPKRGRPPVRERVDPNLTLIKKYGNRRLYDTRRSQYVRLDEVTELIAAGENIRIVDAKTDEDLTKRVMTKIIFLEEERRQLNLLPLSFLRKLIQYRDESLREFYQRYLALSLEVFMNSQRQIDDRLEGLTPAYPPQVGPILVEIGELKARIAELETRGRR